MYAEFCLRCRENGLSPRQVVEALIEGWSPTSDFERVLSPSEIVETLRFARQELSMVDLDLPGAFSTGNALPKVPEVVI